MCELLKHLSNGWSPCTYNTCITYDNLTQHLLHNTLNRLSRYNEKNPWKLVKERVLGKSLCFTNRYRRRNGKVGILTTGVED